MSSSTRRSRTDPDRTAPPSSSRPRAQLTSVGLSPGEVVRWQVARGGRWRIGSALRVEIDGSIEVRDADGALRSLRLERIHVRRRNKAGSEHWEPLSERMARAEQLTLL